jgi:F-type H+-transporting ATPase subunit b
MNTLNHLLIWAQEEGDHAEEPSGLDLILPETAELVWGIVCFVVVLYVLTKVLFPKIRQAVEDREAQIQSDLEAAEAAKNEAQKQQKDYEKQIAEARSEANRVIEDARQQAEQVRKDIIAKAERDAEQVVSRAQEQIEAERNRTVIELQKTVADMSIELAEKVVGRALDDSSHRELVDNYIAEVAAMPGGNGKGSQN